MLHRKRFDELPTLKFDLVQEAGNLRKQAEGMPVGVRRAELLRKAEQVDLAIAVNGAHARMRPGPS